MNYDIFENIIVKDIIKKFKRKSPKKKEYLDRLTSEFDIIIKKKFYNYILQVYELLDLVKDIPHIIRGSSGSSLVCYCLGITNIDPVEDNVCFARFLSETRDSMPDIDFDFPYNKREEVFKRIDEHWNNRVARISNHVMYKEKSATREAIRQVMIEKDGKSTFISREKCNSRSFPNWKNEIENKKSELMGTMRCYSLHCGGIVIYDNQIPDDVRLESKNKNQIIYDKEDVADNGLFKIDILSNRGLAQLFDISLCNIEDYPKNDELITKLFRDGNNIGLTFAESPAMRKILALVKPKNFMDVAFCLALVRPAAANGNKTKAIVDFERGEFGNYLIFDDDAINFIKNSIKCNEGEADKYRRAFSKNKEKLINEFDALINQFNITDDKKKNISSSLSDLRRYSFCKSHAISYGKLVWALAYCKAHFPKEFWKSTLKHCHSSYRKWVHYNEAKTAGVKLKNPKKEITDTNKQYLTFGYWLSPNFIDNCYLNIIEQDTPGLPNEYYVKFRGLIATGRTNKSNTYNYGNKGCTFITLGYDNGKFVDITIDKIVYFYPYHILEGEGILSSYNNQKVSFNRNTNKILATRHKFSSIS